MNKVTEEKVLVLLRKYRNTQITFIGIAVIGFGALLFAVLPYFFDPVEMIALQAFVVVSGAVIIAWRVGFLFKEHGEYVKMVKGFRTLLDNPETYVSYLLNYEKEQKKTVLKRTLPAEWISVFSQIQKAVI